MSFEPFHLATLVEVPNSTAITVTQRPIVESVELCGDNLFVGTNNGDLIHYSISRTNDQYSTKVQNRIQLPAKKAIEQIYAVPTEGTLILFSDLNLAFHLLTTLAQISTSTSQNHQHLKSIVCFSPDKNPTSPSAFSIGKRRQIQTFELLDNNALSVPQDIPTPDGILEMCMYSPIICAADYNQYKIVNLVSKASIPLIPYDKAQGRACMCVISAHEFLVVGGLVGIFVSDCGDVVRGTIEFTSPPTEITFHFPYTVAMCRDASISIHDISTLLLVQKLHFQSPVRCMTQSLFGYETSMDGWSATIRIIFSTRDGAVFGLVAKSLDGQVDEMFSAGLVSRGVVTAEASGGVNGQDVDSHARYMHRVYARAGLAAFKETLFGDAVDYWQKGILDPRVLLSLFPAFKIPIPVSTDGSVSESFLEGIKGLNCIDDVVKGNLASNYPLADAETLDSFGKALVGNATDALLKYLVWARGVTSWDSVKDKLADIDTAIVQIYVALNDTTSLNALLNDPDNQCDVGICGECFQESRMVYALSLLYKSKGQVPQTLDLWVGMLEESSCKGGFGGIEEIIQFLASLANEQILFKYAKIVLAIDAIRGVEIFIKGTHDRSPGTVIDFLKECDFKQSLLVFLEYQVVSQNSRDPDMHLQLAQMYICELKVHAESKTLSRQSQDFRRLEASRITFCEYLESIVSTPAASLRSRFLSYLASPSSIYDPATMLEHLDTQASADDYHIERVKIYTRLKDHTRVLEILCVEVNDTVACQDYISHTASPELVKFLVQLYLRPEFGDFYADQVVALISLHSQTLDIIEVLMQIPGHWSLPLISMCLARSLRDLGHVSRRQGVEKALAIGENMRVTSRWIKTIGEYGPLKMDGKVECKCCGLGIQSCQFVYIEKGFRHLDGSCPK